tara:strand:+ start:5679 stop:7040 length:1362 start_codon:yes stop_codon:yes gene_type:complete
MSAIITDPFKKQFMQNIFDEVTNLTGRYYIGIGKNDQWNATETVPTPTDTPRTIREAQNALQSVKAVAGASFVIPRKNWSSGSVYDAFDDNVAAIPTNSYYVLTEDNQVYICLQQSKNANGAANVSTVKPTGTSQNAFKTSDGYTWKFLYALSAANASAFLSANFVPVEKILDSAGGTGLTAIEIQQATVQDSAVAGRILNVAVSNGGTGYTSAPTITLTGNARAIGDSAQATATVSGGSVVKIEMLNESSGSGKNFTNASVTITGGGGSGAVARAVLGAPNGIGADPRDELKATSLMFNAKPSGIEGGDFLAGTNVDFRQVMLIKNLKDSAAGTLTATTGKALRFLKTDITFAGNLAVDELIFNNTVPPAKAYVNQVSDSDVYFHQTDSTGYTPFGIGDTLTDEQGNTGTINAAPAVEDLINTSGDILYIENRAPVIRDASQTEDIKVVVTL